MILNILYGINFLKNNLKLENLCLLGVLLVKSNMRFTAIQMFLTFILILQKISNLIGKTGLNSVLQLSLIGILFLLYLMVANLCIPAILRDMSHLTD